MLVMQQCSPPASLMVRFLVWVWPGSVIPELQRSGIGTQLLQKVLKKTPASQDSNRMLSGDSAMCSHLSLKNLTYNLSLVIDRSTRR